ncbi:MAG: FAD-dependent oxidoreductase [Candidatus Hodgkinia cicadicola]
MLTSQPEVSQPSSPEVSKPTQTSLTEVKTKTSPPSAQAEGETLQPVVSGTKTPQPVDSLRTERLVVIGSGLSAYSASLSICSAATPPLMITGPTLGGALASPGTIDYWPGAAPDAKSSDLAAALHAQAARLGTRFMHDSVQSIDITTQPYTISTKLGGLLSASAIIVATGLTPKTLNLKGEASLLGRSVFTSAATINGPHKDAAIVGNDCAAINEALALSTMVSQVTLVCGAPQLSSPPSLVAKLSQTANIRVEYNAEVSSYATDESDGGPLFWGLILKRSNEVFTIKVTVAVLALGSEPKVDLLPPEAKTAEGFIKANITNPNLKGIFAAGSILESTPNQLIMLSASGFTAATNALRYLSSAESNAASKDVTQPAASLAEDKTKLAEAKTIATASVPTSQAKADETSKPALAGKSPSAEASSETLITNAPPIAALPSNQSAPSPEKPKQTPNRAPNSNKNPSLALKTKWNAPPSVVSSSCQPSSQNSQLPPLNNFRALAAIGQNSHEQPPKAPSHETR